MKGDEGSFLASFVNNEFLIDSTYVYETLCYAWNGLTCALILLNKWSAYAQIF